MQCFESHSVVSLSCHCTILQDSQLSVVDAELALQMKIYEAARQLREEDHLSKAVKKSRSRQCKREEKKLKRLQEMAFQLRLEHGRSSPLPAFNISQHGERRLARLEDSLPSNPLFNQLCKELIDCHSEMYHLILHM